MSILDWLRQKFGKGPDWPPVAVKEEWDRIAESRARYHNDPAKLLQYSPYFHQNRRFETFTPVPLPRDICRMSSQLLFSEEPRITCEQAQNVLDDIAQQNKLPSFLAEAGERVAYEGRGALRVIRDDSVLPGMPVITYVPGDQVIWEIKHGRFAVGGVAVATRVEKTTYGDDYYRLLERHEPRRITRELYKGTETQLGQKVDLKAHMEFEALAESESVAPGHTTLIQWPNVPGSLSDLHGLDTMLDRINEAASIGVDKMRKSVPKVFADRSIAAENGTVDLDGVILTGDGNLDTSMMQAAVKSVETAQPGLDAGPHVEMMEHLVNLALEEAGYSRASWGRDDGGSADSGKALKIRQTRTLMTRSGKERLAKDAISQALRVALAMKRGGRPDSYDVEIELGDGLPDDPLETAQEIATLEGAESISVEERVRKLHPAWDEDRIEKEVAELQKSGPQPSNPGAPDLDGGRLRAGLFGGRDAERNGGGRDGPEEG